jgi:hypothetical protein
MGTSGHQPIARTTVVEADVVSCRPRAVSEF